MSAPLLASRRDVDASEEMLPNEISPLPLDIVAGVAFADHRNIKWARRRMSTWLITGCSSGLGRALAEAVLARGWNVVMTTRDLSRVEDLVAEYPLTSLALALDVRNSDQVKQVVDAAGERFSEIDVLVNNAGYGYRAAVEEADDVDVQELFATNFFGAVNLIKAILPSMRAGRRGVILNISSIGVRYTAAGSGYYAATKCALEGLSAALRKEVAPLGIKVITVEPGAFRTDFSGRSLTQSRNPIDDYADTAGRRRIENDNAHGTQPGDPARAAVVMIEAVQDPLTPDLLLLGSDAVRIVEAALEAERVSVKAWKAVSISTDFVEHSSYDLDRA